MFAWHVDSTPLILSFMYHFLYRYLATGDSMRTISFSYRVGHSTVCEIIGNTCDAIWKALMLVYLHPPQKEEDSRQINADFENL